MRKNSVDFGCYYNDAKQENLVRTIARATDGNGDNPMIIYTRVLAGGYASEPYYMAENDFVDTYL